MAVAVRPIGVRRVVGVGRVVRVGRVVGICRWRPIRVVLRLCALLLCRFILLRGCIRFVRIRLLCWRRGRPIRIVLRLRCILLRRLLWRLCGRRPVRILLHRLLWRLCGRRPVGIILRRRLIRVLVRLLRRGRLIRRCARLIRVVLLSRLRGSFCNVRLPHRGLRRIVHTRRDRVWRRCNFNRCRCLLFRRLRL